MAFSGGAGVGAEWGWGSGRSRAGARARARARVWYCMAMGLLRPTPTPYDPLDWATRPFVERARMVCRAWALQGYGTPLFAYALHVVKIAFYVGMWVVFCGFTPGMGSGTALGSWWLAPVAFQKAVLWSMLFEGLGMGCGSGPLTGRYSPPLGGFLY